MDVIDLLSSFLGKPHYVNDQKGQASFNCPNCDDGRDKGNLEVNFIDNKYSCWSCWQQSDGVWGKNIKYLVLRYGGSEMLDSFKSIESNINLFRDEYKVETIIRLPSYFKPLNKKFKSDQAKKAISYLKGRNVTLTEINDYKIGYCYAGRYKNRIIIPSYSKFGKVDYFVGRDFSEENPVKYLNPKKPKQNFIFNEFRLNWNLNVFLVEGVFDHMVINNSIPLLGKNISEYLNLTLREKAKSNIYIVLDGDAKEDAEVLYSNLNFGVLKGRIFIIQLPRTEDLSSMNENMSKCSIYKHFSENYYQL